MMEHAEPPDDEAQAGERRRNAIYFTGIAVVGIAGVYVAYMTVDRYVLWVRAILGCAVLYLFLKEYVLPASEPESEKGIHVQFPRDLKSFPLSFLDAILLTWAGSQVAAAIRCYFFPH